MTLKLLKIDFFGGQTSIFAIFLTQRYNGTHYVRFLFKNCKLFFCVSLRNEMSGKLHLLCMKTEKYIITTAITFIEIR